MPSRWLAFGLLLFVASLASAQGVTYVVLWFDTEDYIDPIADDAALRIANDLTSLGVRATFKVVGEKARVLERRGRRDVIQALGKHGIGYHSDSHSIQPAPAVLLQHLGLLEGAEEFERRQRPGFEDVGRIFGVTPVCYGQPGSSWAPQSNLALRRMGVHVYLDEGSQVGLNDQPFWYGGLLYVYNMGPYQIRADLDHKVPASETYRQFDSAVKHFGEAGGGLISTYYHPTEMVHTEFWDAVNFSHGAMRKREEWVLPNRRTAEDAERCFRILKAYVEHAKALPDVRFITANDLLRIYANPLAPLVDKLKLAQHFKQGITFLSVDAGDLSAADILLELSVAQGNYDEAQAALAQAQAQLRQAELKEQEADIQATESQAKLGQALHTVDTVDTLMSQRPAKASRVDSARLDLERCRVVSPFDAYVTNMNIAEGAYARPGAPIFTLIDSRTWYVIANYRESKLKDIHLGDHVDVYLMGHPTRRFNGTVESIGFGVFPEDGKVTSGLPQIERTLNWVHLSTRFPVRVRVTDPDPRLFRIGATAVTVVR